MLNTITPEIFDLPLTRLSVHSLCTFEHDLNEVVQSPDTSRVAEWCSRITHINMGSFDDAARQHLPFFLNLTHLLIGAWNHEAATQEALKLCPRLEVLIWLVGSYRSTKETFVEENSERAPHFDDIRVVTINAYFALDWLRGAEGMDDMWIIAERDIVERRQLKKSSRIDG